MKRMLMTTIGALSLAVTAGAQTPQTPPQPSPTTPQSSTASARPMDDTSLTGCLKAGAEAGSFELHRGKKDKGADSASATASAPSAGAPVAAAAASKNVKLVAGAGVDLASHVGHTVQLSGSWSPASASAGADTTGGAMASAGRTFTVTNVKMVSATCQTGTN